MVWSEHGVYMNVYVYAIYIMYMTVYASVYELESPKKFIW